ncbi:MAG: hypothetical protein WAU24_11970 [Chitinophagaceae bacterium]
MLKYFLTTVFFTVVFYQNCIVEKVSIINLIATPEKYDQKCICVKGFFINEFENRTLFIDKTSAENKLFENGVTLIFDSTINEDILSIYQIQYVEIEGIFNKAKNNNKNTYTHYINKIYKIRVM